MTIEQVLPVNTILQGDSYAVLKELAPKSIRMIFTSPPYMALRDYGVEGQIGLEKSSEEYLQKLWAIFDECYRILADDGTCWVNLGDTFAGSGGAGGDYNDGGLKEGQPKWKQDTYRQLQADPAAHRRNNLKEMQPKCLMMIPERFAWGMIQRNWILRAKIIWFKPNGMIESSKDRPKLDYEMLYMFSKQQKYWFNYIEAKRPLKTATVKRNEYAVGMSQKFHTLHDQPPRPVDFVMPKAGGRKHTDNNGNDIYSGNEVKTHDGMAKIGSVWGLPPESIWTIAPKTFGHEYCETCDILVKSRDLIFKCKQCRTVYGRQDRVRAETQGTNEAEIDGCPKCKSLKREIICPDCENKVHMHFAMFPEELVAPAIRMACPDQVCSKCGEARYPIYTPTEEYSKLLSKGWHDHSDDEQAGQMQEKLVPAAVADYRIKEWTKCNCDAPFTGGIVLDPFAGFATTGAVALKNGMKFVGIELDPKNVKAGMKRLETLRLSKKRTVNVGIDQSRLF